VRSGSGSTPIGVSIAVSVTPGVAGGLAGAAAGRSAPGSIAPHCEQNRLPSEFSCPHWLQNGML
jgi:hypothetical protein